MALSDILAVRELFDEFSLFMELVENIGIWSSVKIFIY